MGNASVIWENQIDDAMYKLRFSKLRKTFKNITYHYSCTHCKYNWFLNRYYPVAELEMTVEHLNKNKINILVD